MLMTTGLVIGFGFLNQYLTKKEIEERELKAFNEERDYQNEVRSWMTKIYQNLKLDHFLAAYQNAKNMPRPRSSDEDQVTEYMQVLDRIGAGLLRNGLLKEAEAVYEQVREFDRQSKSASEALTEIDSRRKLQYARTYLADAQRLMKAKSYRGALEELKKADIELNSCKINNFTEIKVETELLHDLMREARYYVRVEDAAMSLSAARTAFKISNFKKVQDEMAKASNFVGRAAFLKPDGPEILSIRKQLKDLEIDLGFAIPNATPLWNLKALSEQGSDPEFFYLDSYDLETKADALNRIRIKLNYFRRKDDRFFVVRYRIFLADNRDFFNGHFLMPNPDQQSDSDLLSVTFEQEVPSKFLGVPIKRIEVVVMDNKDRLVSRITRAFRGQAS